MPRPTPRMVSTCTAARGPRHAIRRRGGTLYNKEVDYGDQRLVPDPATAAVVPWAADTARFICDAVWDSGEPLGALPRSVFGRVLDSCRRLGYEPLLGVEPEFYLLDGETQEPLFQGYHIFNTVRNTYVPFVQRSSSSSRVRLQHHHRELRVRGLAVGDQLRPRARHGRPRTRRSRSRTRSRRSRT